RPAAVAKDGGEDRPDPEGNRRLVEGDEARRGARIVEEQPDALQHAAHAGSVVGGAEAVVVEPHQSQDSGNQQHGGEGRPFNASSARQVRPSPPPRGSTHDKAASSRTRGGFFLRPAGGP